MKTRSLSASPGGPTGPNRLIWHLLLKGTSFDGFYGGGNSV